MVTCTCRRKIWIFGIAAVSASLMGLLLVQEEATQSHPDLLAQNAQPKKDSPPAAAESDEGVEQVKVEAIPTPTSGPWTLMQIFGRMHPALVHFPMGWLYLLFIMDVITFFFQRKNFSQAGFLILGLTLGSMILAGIAGFLRADQLAPAGENGLVHLHRNLNITAAALGLSAFVLRLWQHNQLRGTIKVIYLSLIAVAVGFISVAGHVGGKMVFGAGYLPF